MTDHEGMRPHELAAEVMGAGYEIVNGRVESARLGNLIDRSEHVWQELADGRFDEDEHGYATVGVSDWAGDYRTDSGDNVDMLHVYYHDPKGNISPLGYISRLNADRSKATAGVAIGEGKHEPLLPADRRWSAVVGVIERAIEQCSAAKTADPGDNL